MSNRKSMKFVVEISDTSVYDDPLGPSRIIAEEIATALLYADLGYKDIEVTVHGQP